MSYTELIVILAVLLLGQLVLISAVVFLWRRMAEAEDLGRDLNADLEKAEARITTLERVRVKTAPFPAMPQTVLITPSTGRHARRD